jgi:hypothetical protein
MREYLSIPKASLPWTQSWKAENLKVIGFLQEQQHRLIIGGRLVGKRKPGSEIKRTGPSAIRMLTARKGERQ